MKLFKYVGSHIAEIVRDNRLKVTQPDRFDDPFEFCPQLDDFTDFDLAEYMRTQKGEAEFVKRLVAAGAATSAEEARQLWNDQAVRLASSFGMRRRIAYKHVEEHQTRASAEFGVICFTENEEDMLMWSWYGRNHQGALIEFDSAAIEKSFGKLLDVDYGVERPKFKPMVIATDYERYIRETVTRKGLQWEAQNEWRALLQFSV